MAQIAPETIEDEHAAAVGSVTRGGRALDIQGILAERNKIKDQVLDEVTDIVLPRQAKAAAAGAESEAQEGGKVAKKAHRPRSRWEWLYKLFGMKVPTLHVRVMEGAVDHIEKMLEELEAAEMNNEVNAYDAKGQTPLIVAAMIGRSDIVALLAEFKAIDINKPHRDSGMAALHYATLSGFKGCVQKLCNRGAFVDVTETSGMTPLMIACALPEIRLVMVLCGARADVNMVDERGWTPLHYAAYAGDTDICGFLLNQGADKYARDAQKKQPRDYAEFKGHGACVAFLELNSSMALA